MTKLRKAGAPRPGALAKVNAVCLPPHLWGGETEAHRHHGTGVIEGREAASACGLLLRGEKWDAVVRVTSAAGEVLEYRLDRWNRC